ncbi:MAG: sialidase family protein [Planctomycetota bacterium]
MQSPLITRALLLSASALVMTNHVAAVQGVAEEGHATLEQVDLFVSGTHDTHTFRIPALAATPQGTLLAICDARRKDASDLPGDIDLVLRRSLDGGRTWSPLRVIQDLPAGHGAGDPSVLVDRVKGRVFCFFAYGPPGVGFFTSKAGSNATDDPTSLHAHVIWSDDEGATWSAPRDLNPSLKDPSWRGLFASSGAGIQLRSGRLIQPYAVMDGAGVTSSRNAYSDDHGATWRMGGAASTDTNESRVVELISGEVVQNVRHNSIGARFLAVSRDGGESFEQAVQDAQLMDPRVNAGLVSLGANPAAPSSTLLVYSSPWHASERRNLMVRCSPDSGASWPRARVVHAGPAAYSSLVVLHTPSGADQAPAPSAAQAGGLTLGLLYERGERSAYERVTFARFDADWITPHAAAAATSRD